MCLAQGHNAVTPVRLEQAAPQSRVKHFITEPLRSIYSFSFFHAVVKNWKDFFYQSLKNFHIAMRFKEVVGYGELLCHDILIMIV